MLPIPSRSAVLAACLLAAAPLSAQIAGGHALVLTNNARPGVASELLDVDPGTGSFRSVGRFPSDFRRGLAVAVDPVRGDAVVAVAEGAVSFIARVSLLGGVAGPETILAAVPGEVTDVAVALDGDVYCTTGGASGAVYEIARTGGPPIPMAATPFATAIATPNLGSGVLTVALSGDQAAGTHPGVVIVDIFSHVILAGPYHLVGHRPLHITGIRSRYIPPNLAFVDEGGNMWLLSLPSTVRQFGSRIPALPPGGSRALTLEFNPLRWVVLGGAAHPYLKTVPDLTTWGGGWTNLAGPLPGDPVDFGLQLPPPRVALFDQACRPGAALPLNVRVYGSPQLGSPTFAVGVARATPGSPVLLVFGGTDLFALGTVRLPLALAGGCELLVGPEVTVARTADGAGDVRLPLPVPADPALVGAVLLMQGMELPPSLMPVTTAGLAMHIGL